jgi:proton-dependent oligopeptide transporter, POT family
MFAMLFFIASRIRCVASPREANGIAPNKTTTATALLTAGCHSKEVHYTMAYTTLKPEDELPSNISTVEQLECLPDDCRSGDPQRPLRHVDDKGMVYHYSLRPMSYSVLLVLVVELMERFSYYGIYYTMTMYLTGVYDEDWNAGFRSVEAASYVSISTAVAYTTPFIGAVIADSWLGDYKSILFGVLCLYLPGLVIIALTTVPHLLGSHFNTRLLSLAVLFLWPLGTGVVKSVVNVFGARQFHPFLQSSLIENYYVNFYASINIGALTGICFVPVLARTFNPTTAYTIPIITLSLAMVVFLLGTPRFIISKPAHSLFQTKSASGGSSKIPLTTMFRISLLIVPFCMAYSQMPTVYVLQGTVMDRAFGFVDAATINSVDTISVLAFGYVTSNYLYPELQRRNIKIPTTYKFAIGSCLGALSIGWALVVEDMIHSSFLKDGTAVSILWQAPSYILIGFGEIFAVSAAYEVAFTTSTPQTKVLASAINIFCVGGIPNVLCIFLVQACKGWFRNSRGNADLHRLEDYATAHVGKYFLVLIAILSIGIIINTLPMVRDFVDGVEKKVNELVRTPMTPRHPPIRPDEETPLIRKQFGDRPVLYKMGSMRAGTISKMAVKKIKAKYLHKLYQNKAVVTGQTRHTVAPMLKHSDTH